MQKIWQTYSLEQIKQMVAETRGFNELTAKMGYKKGNSYTNNQLRQYFEENNIDYSHYNGQAWRAGKQLKNLEKNDFGVITPAIIKKRLIEERGKRCESCQASEWMGYEIPIQVHHIDGDRSNNLKENLLLLCPNCHAITDNWCGKNTRKVTEEDIIKAAKISKTYSEICSRVGWSSTADHYARIKKVLDK